MPLPVWLVCGFERARGTAGSARCVSLGPPPLPDISAGPSSATTSAPPGGTRGCNSVVAPAAGETAVRILSTGIRGFAAGGLTASGARRTRDGPVGVYNPREGPWEVMSPRSSCPGEDSTPLWGDSGHPVQRKLNTLSQDQLLWFCALLGIQVSPMWYEPRRKAQVRRGALFTEQQTSFIDHLVVGTPKCASSSTRCSSLPLRLPATMRMA